MDKIRQRKTQKMAPKHQTHIAPFGQYIRYPSHEVVETKEQPNFKRTCLSRERGCARQPG